MCEQASLCWKTSVISVPSAHGASHRSQTPLCRGYWAHEEEESLRRGVQKHGIGAWERIRHDPEFKILKCDSALIKHACVCSQHLHPLLWLFSSSAGHHS